MGEIDEARKEVARDILIALKYVLKEPAEDKYSRDRDIDVVLEFFSKKYHVKVDLMNKENMCKKKTLKRLEHSLENMYKSASSGENGGITDQVGLARALGLVKSELKKIKVD